MAVRQFDGGQPVGFETLTYGVPGLVRAVVFGTFFGLGCASVFWWIVSRRTTQTA